MTDPGTDVVKLPDGPGIDIGGEHRLWWRADGDLWWLHPGCGYHHVDVTSGTRHTLTLRDPITIQGSLLCLRKGGGPHGFVENGAWRDA